MSVTVSTVARRRTELGLLLLALLITGSAYALVSLGRTADLPTNLRPFLLVIGGLLGIAHIATRRYARFADASLLALAGVLNGIGYVFIARLKPDLANKQAAWTGIGIGAYVLTLIVVRQARRLEYLRYTFAFGGSVLLLLPLVPGVGYERNGSRIWVHLGPVSFQPGEIAKLTLAVFFASYQIGRAHV